MGDRDAVVTPHGSSPTPRPLRLLVGLWPLLLAVVMLAPLLVHRGYPLARDLVFVPHQPLTDASVGLGGVAPRAVPLDAVVSLADTVLDGAVLARVALLLALALAGWGMLRLTAPLSTWARLAASGFAVWNPFVVERMALGQWDLVTAYAVLPWVVLAAARYRRTGERSALASVVLWSALASLTPTGGLLALAASLTAGAARRPRTWWLVVTGLLLQLPWVVPSFVGGASTTADPAGVAVFAPGSDSAGSPLVALVGLGGIWDGLSVPATRHSPFAVVTAVLVVLVLVLGLRSWWRLAGDLAPRVAGFGFGGLVLAVLLTTSAGQAALRWAIETLPGLGLLRDGQKLIAPFVMLVGWVLAAAVDALVTRLTPYGIEVVAPVGVLVVLLPVLLIPDGAGKIWSTVRPVSYPAALDHVVATIDASPPGTGVVTLPWRSYRNFSWGRGTTSSDPLVRMVDRPVVTDEDLTVGDSTVHGESSLVRRLGTALAAGTPADVLPDFGIGWVVVYPDDPAAGDLDLTGLQQVYAGPEVRLYAVPGAADLAGPAAWRRTAVVVGDVLASLTVLWAAVTVVAAWRSRRRGRQRAESVLESPQPPQEESC